MSVKRASESCREERKKKYMRMRLKVEGEKELSKSAWGRCGGNMYVCLFSGG